MAKKKDAVGFQIIALDGKPVADTIPNDVAEEPDKSEQLVLEIHNETFRLPEDWARFRDWADAWRRVAKRNPRYRPEDDTVDHYLRAAMAFCLGKLHWSPDTFWRMTLQEYDAALAGYYDAGPAAATPNNVKPPRKQRTKSRSTPRAAVRQAFASIDGWETMPPEFLRRAIVSKLGYSVSPDTIRRARQE